MANNWKIAGAAKIKVPALNSGNYIEDCTIIGFPNEMRSLIEITALNSTRKEFVLSDIADSDEITFTAPYTGIVNSGILTTSAQSSCQIFLPKLNSGTGYTYTFDAFITKMEVTPSEIDGKLGWTISLKPTTVLTRS